MCSVIFSGISDPRVPPWHRWILSRSSPAASSADKWAAVLLALGGLSELWSLEGDFDFSVLMVTCAVVPDLVIRFVSLALRAGCGGCLAGAAPKRSPSTGAFD